MKTTESKIYFQLFFAKTLSKIAKMKLF